MKKQKFVYLSIENKVSSSILLSLLIILDLGFISACGGQGSKSSDNGGLHRELTPGPTPSASSNPAPNVSDDEVRSMAAAASDPEQDTASCRDILASGIYNTHREAMTESATQALRRNFCGESESYFSDKVRAYYKEKHSSSSSQSASGSAGIDYMGQIGLDFSAAEADSSSNNGELTTEQAHNVISAWKQKYCSNNESYSTNDFAHYIQTTNVAPEVVSAWRSCVTRAHHGFFCSSKSTGDLISIELQWQPSEVQRRVLPTVNLKWDSVANLQPITSSLPETLGTGSGKSVGFQRKGLHEAALIQVSAQDAKGLINFKCSLPIPAAIQLQYRQDESCGIDLFKKQTSELCGAASYKSGNGAVCGVSSYNLSRSPACGVERYNERNDAVCGLASERGEWRISNSTPHLVDDPNYDCADQRGCRRPKIEVRSLASIQAETSARQSQGDLTTFCRQNYDPAAVSDGWRVSAVGDSWRVEVNCHVSIYQTCRHENFGVELYHECRDASHGVETFNSCRNPAFGVEAFNECRRSEFGVESYKSCLTETRTIP